MKVVEGGKGRILGEGSILGDVNRKLDEGFRRRYRQNSG